MTQGPPGDSAIGRVLGGQYRIDSLLGQGGMGSVYRAVQLSVNRAVAIKLISAQAPNQPELERRFRREAEATARLSHPNTVRLFDFGVTDHKELFMVMELLEGNDLSGHLQAGGPMTVGSAFHVTRQVLSALSEAHAVGIVHRDLKPGNVFLLRLTGGEIFVKVMDFGIAGIEQARETAKLTVSGAVMGTPAYMSPEQAQGRSVDARSDLYSLGVMLFEMLTGRSPYEADTVMSLLLAHVTQPPKRLAECGASLPQHAGAQQLLDLMLAKLPSARPPTAAATIELLDQLQNGAPTLNQSPSLRPTLATTVSPATPLGWPVEPTAAISSKPQRRVGVVAIVTAFALVGVGGVAWWRANNPADDPTSTEKTATVATPQSELEPTHEVTITSTPSGARVLLDNDELGRTPYTFPVSQVTQLALELPGYAKQSLRVDRESAATLTVALRRESAAPVVTPPSAEALRGNGADPNPPAATDPGRAAPPTAAEAERGKSPPPSAANDPTREPPAPPSAADDNTAARTAGAPPSAAHPNEPARRPGAHLAQDKGRNASKLSRKTGRGRRPGEGAPDLDPSEPSEPREAPSTRNEPASNAAAHQPAATEPVAYGGAPPFPSIGSAQRAYNSGKISSQAYDAAVSLLKARRQQRIASEQDNLAHGVISPEEYEWRLSRIDAEFRGD
jgi:serine/threonine protein kinase